MMRRRKDKTEAKEPKVKEPKVKKTKDVTGRGSEWTHGRELSGKFLSALLFLAIVAGVAGFGMHFIKPEQALAAPAEQGPGGLTAAQQSAGAYAVGFVGSWLSATKDKPGDLGTYVDLGSLQKITQAPFEYRDLALVSVSPVDGGPFVSAVVAANVKEIAQDQQGNVDTWPRRYFQVAVAIDGSALRVVGLPAPIAPPVEGRTTSLVYATAVASGKPLAQTVSAFLSAYLAGSGELDRFTTPGSALAPIMPAPYAQLNVVDLRTATDPVDAPADGTTARALATVTLTTPLEQITTATYALTLTARGQRWEVTDIDLAPQANPKQGKETPAPKPTPSSTGDTKGN
jgi:hypothetical protein